MLLNVIVHPFRQELKPSSIDLPIAVSDFTRNATPFACQLGWQAVFNLQVFDAALKRELHEVMQEAKQKVHQIREPADVWELEQYLTQRRKDIDRKYEFRSSRLTQVFATLLFEGRVTEEEVRGLGQEKMKAIRSGAKFLSEEAA